MRRRRASGTFIAILLALALLAAPIAQAATKSDLASHEQKAADARAKAKAAEAAAAKLATDIEDLETRMTAIENDIAALAGDINKATTRTERLQSEVLALRAQVTAKQADIDATQAEYERGRRYVAATGVRAANWRRISSGRSSLCWSRRSKIFSTPMDGSCTLCRV